MSVLKRTKLADLMKSWPAGAIVSQSWLDNQGIYNQLTQKYIQGGWLNPVGFGAYQRAGDLTDWTGGVFGLQHNLRHTMHLGGITTLNLLGQSHFINKGKPIVQLFNTLDPNPVSTLPKWFKTHFNNHIDLQYHRTLLFNNDLGITEHNCKTFSLKMSCSERALLEILSLVPRLFTFQHAYYLLEGKVNLRVDLLQELLESCNNYQAKRLFLYLAKQANLPCIDYLKVSSINLGKGQRRIPSPGPELYIPELMLTVPKLNLESDDNEVLF